jgi:subtilisin family serine protease
MYQTISTRFLGLFVFLILIVASCTKETNQLQKKKFLLENSIQEDGIAPVYKSNKVEPGLEDSYIVVFNDDVNENEVDGESDRMCGSAKVTRDRTYKHALKGFSSKLTPAAIEEMRRNPKVKYIEQNQVATIVATQNSATWGLDRIDQPSLPLTTTYTYNTNGSAVDAYIFDTGIRLDHAEFSGRLGAGYNAINTAATANDDQGHGTHVAGTVGGTTYGVAKGVTLIPVKVLNNVGSGTYDQIIAGIDWAVANHTTRPAVGNMSLGGGVSVALNDAVRRAITDGIIMCVAAGNNGLSAANYSPASTIEAITVGATTNTDALATYSNRGSIVDILAPGSAVISAYFTNSTATASLSGTSMASPHVAGAAALYLEYSPGATTSQVQTALKSFAAVNRISGVPAGTVNELLQINFGTVPPLPAPIVPVLSSPAANATGQSLTPTLSWTASMGAVTYNLQVSTSSTFATTLLNLTNLTSTSRALSGLANSTVYYWRVSATNTVGTSAWSAVRSFTTVAPLALPAAPVLSAPANNATNQLTATRLSWGAAARATTYEVQVSLANTFATTAFSRNGLTARNVTISPALAARTTYYWRVRAVNSAGAGAWSATRQYTTR